MSSAHGSKPNLLIVDDDDDLRDVLCKRFQRSGLTVTAANCGQDALQKVDQARCDVALLDLHLPDMTGIDLLGKLKERWPELEAIMLTGHGSVETAIQAMKLGAYDYLAKPVHMPTLDVRIDKAFEKVRLARRERQWVEQVAFQSDRYRLVGSSKPLQRVLQLIEKVAPTEATVLIRGASGTGKELVARALHFNSPRRQRPLVTINCAALQESLLESELFGHEKGSFTGATQAKPGLIEVAEGGTLFIDEVAEMGPGLQAKLLRVLEDGHYRRVGSTQEAHADVRIVAATNKNLEHEQKEGNFREDLYFRLNVITVPLPALRDRPEDIPELVHHFLTTRQIGPHRFHVAADVLAVLSHYSWPGNVRELANVIERAQILAQGNVITIDDLPDNMREGLPQSAPVQATSIPASVPTAVSAPAPAAEAAPSDLLHDVERRHVKNVLMRCQDNKVHAARLLGISRRALYRLVAKYKLDA